MIVSTFVRRAPVVIVTLAIATASMAGNMLVNPGFETGDFTAWPHSSFAGSITVSPGNGHSGNFGVKFSSVNSASMLIGQDLAPLPTSQIDGVSLWYKRTGSPNASPAVISLLYSDSSSTSVATDAAASGWTFLDLTASLQPGKSLQTIQISAAGAGQNVVFDDVYVGSIPAPGVGTLGALGLGWLARRRRR